MTSLRATARPGNELGGLLDSHRWMSLKSSQRAVAKCCSSYQSALEVRAGTLWSVSDVSAASQVT